MSYAYNINDTIMYGSQGICKIEDIENKDFSGSPSEYYVLKPIENRTSTIYVPVNNEKLVNKMRKILSASEIYELIKSMPNESCEWTEDNNKRKAEFKEILSEGDRIKLVKMIKALYKHQQEQKEKGKKLNMTDERFFKEAEKMLYNEFALVLNIKPNQVLPFIMEQIEVEEKA